MVTITRKLDMTAGRAMTVVNLSQYDDDFTIIFDLYMSDGVISIQSGTTAEIRGTKRSGHGYSADASISGTRVTVTGDKQLTAIAGRNEFEIVLIHSGKEINSANFILNIERAALDQDTIKDADTIKEIKDLNYLADEIPEAMELVRKAEEWTQHPPYIGGNGNWYIYDANNDEFIDSGIDASITITMGTTTTLDPSQPAYVTNTGTNTDPIFNFGIPQGETGPQGVKGDKGDKGDTGDTGPQGVKGDKGDKGDTGETGPQGVKGDKGDKGDPALTFDVDSPTILEAGENPDVENVGTDTDIILHFSLPKGAKGDKGDKGDTGAQGIQGSKGDKGDKGDTGPQGIQGPQGETGPQGAKGDKGDTGVVTTSIHTLYSNAWIDNAQTVTISGITSNTNALVSLSETATETQREAARNAMLSPTNISTNTVTITADGEVPDIDIPIIFAIL